MATTKKAEEAVETNVIDYEELVTYTAPRPTKEDFKDIFVSVNGENIQIKRGETVKIKRKFYEVLMQSEAMQTEAYRRSQELAN